MTFINIYILYTMFNVFDYYIFEMYQFSYNVYYLKN